MSQSECKTCDGLGQIVVGGPYCQGPFQPPEYATQVCDMCGGSGKAIAEQPVAPGLPELLIALGCAGVAVSGGTHGDPWRITLPIAEQSDTALTPRAPLGKEEF